MLLAAVALVAATFLALAALETATAMQVLYRDRRISPPCRRTCSRPADGFGPLALRALEIEHLPEWPVGAVPGAVRAATGHAAALHGARPRP